MNFAWSRVGLELVIETPTVKQGEILSGKLIVKQAEGQTALAGLQGKNISKTLYLLKVAPFMGKLGTLESEVKIIFLTVPQTNAVSDLINNEEVFIVWNNVEVLPTETSKSFLLGDFDIPSRKKILMWFLVSGLVFFILAFAIWARKKKLSKKKLKLHQDNLKQALMNCSSYDQIVQMWSNKKEYLSAFPKIENRFKTFEEILFKYQFKSTRTDSEIQEIMIAYKDFKAGIAGVINEA